VQRLQIILRKRVCQPSDPIPEGFPFCRHGRTVPRNAWLVRPSPCRIGSCSGPANCRVSLSYHPCLPCCLSHCKQQGSLSPRALPRFIDTTNPSYSLSSSTAFPVFPVIRLSAPPISRRDEEGLSSCLACPCHRAVASTPPEWKTPHQSVCVDPCCFRLPVEGSAPGSFHFRGQICVHFRYGPMTCSPS
jgi:hypothetical protein